MFSLKARSPHCKIKQIDLQTELQLQLILYRFSLDDLLVNVVKTRFAFLYRGFLSGRITRAIFAFLFNFSRFCNDLLHVLAHIVLFPEIQIKSFNNDKNKNDFYS